MALSHAAPKLLAACQLFEDAQRMTSAEFADAHGTKARPGALIPEAEKHSRVAKAIHAAIIAATTS